jgi:Ca2+-binding RTX toxin-like protein
VNDDTLAGNGGDDFMDAGAGNDQISGGNGDDTLIAGSGADTLTGGDGADLYRFTNFTPGEVDVIIDFFGALPIGDRIEISAKAFGGSLIANTDGNISTSNGFFVELTGSGVPSISTAPIGTSEVYYDSGFGGLYFDRDGAGTGTGFVQFAKFSPVPGFDPAPNIANYFIIVD